MLVYPEVLRGFAKQVDIATAAMDGMDSHGRAESAADGLSGSSTQWTTRQVGNHVGLAARDIQRHVARMGVAVRGAGDRYEVDDDALAGDFERLF